MNKFLIFLINILFFSFAFPSQDQIKLSKKEQISNEITFSTADTLAKRHDILFIGEGARMMYEIEQLSLSFEIRHPISKETARSIAVDCVEEFLKNVNNSKEIRPYLKNYPFTPENISIILFVCDENGYDLFHPDLAVVNASHDKIIYKTNDQEKKHARKEITEESYEHAAKLVKSRSGSL